MKAVSVLACKVELLISGGGQHVVLSSLTIEPE